MCGKLVANAVADWMAGKTISPMLLLGTVRWGFCSKSEERCLPVVETKGSFNLADCCSSGDLDRVLV